jgi:hypothetical protein
MIEVKLPHRDPNNIMEIVRLLRDKGLKQGKDFDFAYNQATYDPITGHHVTDRYTSFYFYDEKWATWLLLKYQA